MAPEHVAFLLAAAAAAATLLGWALVALKRSWTSRHIGIALLVSAAAMVVISVVELLPPGLRDPELRTATLIAFAVGLLAVPLLGRLLDRLAPSLSPLESTAFLVMLTLALHNIPEGTVVFAASIVSLGAGVVTAIAIALHNIPEGMAVATSVIAAGGSRRRALAYTAMSAAGEGLGALGMLLLGAELSTANATALLSLVAGIMVALSLTEIGPAGLRLVRGDDAALAAAPVQLDGSPARGVSSPR